MFIVEKSENRDWLKEEKWKPTDNHLILFYESTSSECIYTHSVKDVFTYIYAHNFQKNGIVLIILLSLSFSSSNKLLSFHNYNKYFLYIVFRPPTSFIF